jgi:hypothetical protein
MCMVLLKCNWNTKRYLYGIWSDNLRKYLLSAGYVFGDSDDRVFEPSLLFQLVDKTKEKSIDINIKA